MEDTTTDFGRGMDKGLEMALDVINSTADVRFESIAEVALYLHDPVRYADYRRPKLELGKVPTPD